MKVTDFDYELPEELIAQHPVEPRDTARLLTLDKVSGEVKHKGHFYDLLEELHEGDVLVFNNTKVIPARLYGHRQGSGGKVEVLLLTPCGENRWECLVKPGKKCPIGQVIEFDDRLSGVIIDKTNFGGRIIQFTCNGVFDDVIQEIGEMPLPPYIHEKLNDPERYQTVYSKIEGSAAAPTAGLHFTKEIFDALRAKEVTIVDVTLHVGLGTFRPMDTEHVKDHDMHAEVCMMSKEAADTLNKAKAEGRRIFAIGTTSVRTLESVWNVYGKFEECSLETKLFIYPGYKYHTIDGMLTNFHLPKSTLIMMICALAGYENVMNAYKEAVKEQYRFFSFGDCMLLTNE